MSEHLEDLYAIVPAGGAGTRLWPLSRSGHPKFLLDLTGSGRTLIQQTVDRLQPITTAVMVVTGAAHASTVAAQLPELCEADLIAEPSARDSAAAIGLAAAVIAVRHPGAVVGSFAADHVVRDVAAFHAAVAEAVAVARTGDIVTIGITPTGPSTAFGYIRPGEALKVDGAPSAVRVDRFVEKPDAATAADYVEQGYRWNAGMFVARADALLAQLAEHRPELHAGLVEIAAVWDTPQREQALQRLWPTLERVAIDYAVAEPAAAAGRVAVIPADIGWDDIGDFASLAGLLEPADYDGADRAGDFADAGADTGAEAIRVLGSPAAVLAQDSSGLVVPGSGRLVAVLGVDDVVVIDTPDAVLVTTAARAQDVKSLVSALQARARLDLL
ncbi:MAG: mannose-1-phosphate guanylyltransferase [Kineosporiaceae bacterium]|nr:mannose-1-phosphate guanylyltransferase [Kineosporiaceae bacterium]